MNKDPREKQVEQKNLKYYSQTCIRRPLLGSIKSGRHGELVVLQNIFVKRPQTKTGRS